MKRTLPIYIILLCAMLVIPFAPAAHANSAEPPMLTVIVALPPDDLEITIRFVQSTEAESIPLQREDKGWESYFRFFYYMDDAARSEGDGATLTVSYGGRSKEHRLSGRDIGRYNTLLTLDIDSGNLVVGQPPLRVPLLVTMRVMLTLLIEGLVLFLFGYRKRASWIAFLIVNLITQGGLNLLFEGPMIGGYWFIAYFILEIVILVAEMLTFAFILKEHRRGRGALFALIANIASLFLGAVIIGNLPV